MVVWYNIFCNFPPKDPAHPREIHTSDERALRGRPTTNSARRNPEAGVIPGPTRISDWDPLQGGGRGGSCSQSANGCKARGGVQTRKHRKGVGVPTGPGHRIAPELRFGDSASRKRRLPARGRPGHTRLLRRSAWCWTQPPEPPRPYPFESRNFPHALEFRNHQPGATWPKPRPLAWLRLPKPLSTGHLGRKVPGIPRRRLRSIRLRMWGEL